MKQILLVAGGGLAAALIAGIAVLVLFWGSSTPPPAVDTAPQVVAVVNGQAITERELDAEIKISRLNIMDPAPALTGEAYEAAKTDAVNQLIIRTLILQAAARHNFSLDDDFIASRVDLLFGGAGEEALTTALEMGQTTRADLTWWVRQIFTVEEFTTQYVLAEVAPENRQQTYNSWLNEQRTAADVEIYLDRDTSLAPAMIGSTAPDFTLNDIHGSPVSLSDYRGQVVLVNFWATWCPPCLTEMPTYEQAYQTHQPNLIILGVNMEEEQGRVAEFARGLGLTFPVLLDPIGDVTSRHYQVTGLPSSFLIDQQGQIYYRHLGPMNAATLAEKLAELGL